MLYKKYHKDFVNQFKVGIRFKLESYNTYEVLKDPCIFESCIFVLSIICSTKRQLNWKLISSSGVIVYKKVMKFIENVV